MSWLFLALIVVVGFALLKVRRRRKAQQAGSSYSDSKSGVASDRERSHRIGDRACEGDTGAIGGRRPDLERRPRHTATASPLTEPRSGAQHHADALPRLEDRVRPHLGADG